LLTLVLTHFILVLDVLILNNYWKSVVKRIKALSYKLELWKFEDLNPQPLPIGYGCC